MNRRQAAIAIGLISAYLILFFIGLHSVPLVINGRLPETGLRSSIYYLIWFFGAFSGWLLLTKLDANIQKYLIALVCLLAFLCPPWSQDVFNYLASSRVWIVYDQNPYLYSLHYLNQNDPFLGASVWDKHVTPYGPLITLLQAPLAYFSLLAEPYFETQGRYSILIPIYGFKLMLLAVHFLNIYLIGKITEVQKQGVEFKQRAIWLYAVNPLILYESLATAHNELILASLLLLSFYLFCTNKGLFSALFVLFAFLAKYTSGILLSFYLVFFLRKKKYLSLVLFSCLCVLVIFNTYLWIDTLPTYKLFLSKISEVSWGSLPHYLAVRSPLKDYFKEITIFSFFYALGCFSSVAVAFHFIRQEKYLEAFISPLFIFCLYTTPVFNNWYLILPLSFACLLKPSVLRTSIFIFAICSQFALLQFFIYRFDLWPHPETQIALTFIPTIGYMLFQSLNPINRFHVSNT